MFVTCHGSGGEQLQGTEISVLVCEFFLAVGVNREVDGGEGDVTQEAGFGSLMVGIKNKKRGGGVSIHTVQCEMASVMCRDSGGGAPCKGLGPRRPIQPLSVDSERVGSLQAELHHWAFAEKSIMHAHAEPPDASVAPFLCQVEVCFFSSPPPFFFFTSSTLSVPH